MKYLIPILALAASPALAEEPAYPEAHITALACTENLDVSTTWEQCLGVIFQDCAGQEVGSVGQLSCLDDTRKSWSTTVESLQADVTSEITGQGASELATLLGQWTGYVVQKCQGVAETKPEDGQEAARVGCEITEMVGLSGELAACLEGRSTADYCKRP